MKFTDQQWSIIAPIIKKTKRMETRGRPRRNDKEIMEGILWILKTGAQWSEMPNKYPPYQTCHRRYQEWVELGVFNKALTVLAQDMEQRGGIKLEECFIDGTFASAKKGGIALARQNAEKAARLWSLRTKTVFQSPSIWPLLLRMKSSWWKKRLPKDLQNRILNF
jgi:transposase